VSADNPIRPVGGALILAAGFGRRFGSDKRAHKLPGGQMLLQATCERYAEVYERICVVLRPEDEALARQIRGLSGTPEIALATDARLGMGHSLAAGIRTVGKEWRWASVALGDMPYIRAATLSELLDAFFAKDAQRIVQPAFNGIPGHPVTFPGDCFEEMRQLQGDQGARALLSDNERLLRYPVSDPGVLDDVDTPEAAAATDPGG
jgi:molybdenum cofactor cytidylyltransferase